MFHPDRPVGSEWDTTSLIAPSPPVQRTPGKPQDQATQDQAAWSSDDEAPPDRNPMMDHDERAADLSDAPNKTRRKQQHAHAGNIYGSVISDKAKSKRFHVAVVYDEVPEHIVGSKDKTRRTAVQVSQQELHVLCDTRVVTAHHTRTTRIPVQLGFTLCNICRSRRRRWREHTATAEILR